MNYKFKTKPYAHQLTALEKSWNKETFAYFMEMGTGKSKVLLDNMAMLYDHGKINGVLIISSGVVVLLGMIFSYTMIENIQEKLIDITVEITPLIFMCVSILDSNLQK